MRFLAHIVLVFAVFSAALWLLATTLPVGAMLFWLRRPKLIAAYRARQASEAGA